MGWFIINIISSKTLELEISIQQEHMIDEYFFLVEADSKKTLDKKILNVTTSINNESSYFYKSSTRLQINNNTLDDNEQYFLGDGVAVNRLVGVRKIYPLSANTSNMYDKVLPPNDGDFIVCSSYKISSRENILKFIKGKPTPFIYLVDKQINLLDQR